MSVFRPVAQSTETLATSVADLIAAEPKMLHPSPDSIVRSIEGGLASVLEEQGEPVAFCRFIPLLTSEKIQALGLPDTTPQIWELGSVIVAEGYRGQKKGQQVVKDLHSRHLTAIQSRQVLVVGTTTTRNMLGVVAHASELGVFYVRTRPTVTPLEYIGATTCVCEPGEVLGQDPTFRSIGVHHGAKSCEIRTGDSNIYSLTDPNSFPTISSGYCGMFVSDLELALELNGVLKGACERMNVSLPQYTELIMM